MRIPLTKPIKKHIKNETMENNNIQTRHRDFDTMLIGSGRRRFYRIEPSLPPAAPPVCPGTRTTEGVAPLAPVVTGLHRKETVPPRTRCAGRPGPQASSAALGPTLVKRKYWVRLEQARRVGCGGSHPWKRRPAGAVMAPPGGRGLNGLERETAASTGGLRA